MRKIQITAITIILFISIFILSCGDTEKTEVIKNEQGNTLNKQDTAEKLTDLGTDTNNTMDTNKTDTTKSDMNSGTESNIVTLETSMGNITIELYEKDAPKHTENFKKLVKSKFYEGTTFHRVIAGFMIQGGDPNSKDNDRTNDGVGGPGYTIPAEIKAKHEKGAVAGARLGDAQNPQRASSGSQFYIVTGEASHLDDQYTVFGKVIKGLDVAMKIEKVKVDGASNPTDKVVIKRVFFDKK